MIIELLRWWYVQGWATAARRVISRTTSVAHAFSTVTLLKTLFSPWRRVVSVGGRTLDDRIRGAIDNLISRTVGFFSRLIVLSLALVLVSGSFILGVLIVLAWPFVPILSIGLIVKGLM